MTPEVVVLDYGSGNLRSVVRAVERAGATVTLTGDFDTALAADGLVVPGVGAYAACMEGLRAIKGERIIGRRLAGGRPVLGICVGMQVLFAGGVEHGVETDGCDEWPGLVTRLEADVVPHMGWNTVEVPAGSRLFAGVEDERFYFVHSYAARTWDLVTNDRTAAPLVTWAEHGGDRFVAAVENGPLSATQFHPEKSGDAGAELLRNWVASLRRRGLFPVMTGTMSMNQIIHAAVRRDVARTEQALRALPDGDAARARQIQVAWRNLVRELTHHHEAEDELLWPFLQSRGVELSLLEEMEAEHVAMKTALADVAAALETSSPRPPRTTRPPRPTRCPAPRWSSTATSTTRSATSRR